MALQRLGAADMRRLLAVTRRWAKGSDYERRAAVAALCEPALLRRREDVAEVFAILDEVTAGIAATTDRRRDDFRTLRLALGYCWSVSVAASPAEGRRHMERWMRNDDRDVRWVMRQNLSKKRIAKAGDAWVVTWRERVGARPR
jgi:hypothetical protein